MPRYIDADKIAKWSLEQFSVVIPSYYDIIDAEELTEDVAPVVHAHWIKHGEPPWYVIECSECGAKWQMSGSWDANNFCGNCGAKMDEEVS